MFENGVTLPGVMLANVSMPYTGFKFNKVTSRGFMSGDFLLEQDYVCKNVKGTADKTTAPCLPALLVNVCSYWNVHVYNRSIYGVTLL